MKHVRDFLVVHAKTTLVAGIVLLLAAGAYGFGLFSMLGDTNDNFFAFGTPSVSVNDKVHKIFGANKDEVSIVLFEAKDMNADITTDTYAQESYRILKNLGAKSITNYYYTHADQFVSRDKHATYAIVTLDGTKDEQYKKLTDFSSGVKSDLFSVSVGGSMVGQKQTQEQAKTDLEMAEIISLPILALLLFWFFRSPIAAVIPLVMSALTIAGALAVSRVINHFFPVDTYTLNVISILSVGLSIDYSLLAVNRFRDELSGKRSPLQAAQKTMRTAGRTVFFSGLTVIVCLLSLLLFPVGFMHSVSIGGAASVAVAVIISTLLLPPTLKLLGKNINKWSVKPHKSGSKGWQRLALTVTGHPVIALVLGIAVIAALVWPVRDFTTKTFDWHVLPNNQSAYHVGQVLDEKFDVKTPVLTLLAEFPTAPTPEQLCSLSDTVKSVDGVEGVQAAYVSSPGISCQTMPGFLQSLQLESPQTTAVLSKNASQYTNDNYALVQIVPAFDASDARTRELITRLQQTNYDDTVKASVTGQAARAQDTLDVYKQKTPYVIAVIAIAMVVVLTLSLGSMLLPIQAIIINSLALFISLGVLVMVFQFGWLTSLLHMNQAGGFELSIPILIFVMAFGLSMDYAVFLYSRMHEVHDITDDPKQAIVQGVTKTGPIITSAALLLFVVVAAFATSRISIIQQIGLGLSVAVLVDAFFVRIVFVPAVMSLFGKASWWAPKWVKKLTIKHD